MGRSSFQATIRAMGGLFMQGPGCTVNLTDPVVNLSLDANAGKINRVNNATATINLPPINNTPSPKSSGPGGDPSSDNNVGVTFTLVFETAATAAKIVAQGTDRLIGTAAILGSAFGAFNAVPATTTTINLNGTTTGGAVGTLLTLQALPSGKWLLRDANLVATGAPATPFS